MFKLDYISHCITFSKSTFLQNTDPGNFMNKDFKRFMDNIVKETTLTV